MSEAQESRRRFLSREEYRRWAERQPRGGFELVAGEVVAMAPERVGHALVKASLWRALDDAVRKAGIPCQALPDRVTIEIGGDTDYEPDAIVNCGERLDREAMAAPNPVIIAEVLSPTTASVDTGRKLADYFSLPSVRHYLILRADKPQIIHHERREDEGIVTRIITEGEVRMEPPGIAIQVEEVYRD
jgi:Uma2 family endonuclease